MTTIHDAFINALLADAAYVPELFDGEKGETLEAALKERMTSTLAKYIGDNFTVVTQVSGLASSLDATVWKDKSGKLYVSMRGTQQLTDFIMDGDLAFTGNARSQVTDMVNWWLRETTPPGQSARQITWNPFLSVYQEATPVVGTGKISAADLVGGIEVNGHSLGGYLASAFTRLFGEQAHVGHATTFNSAGFAPGSEAAFQQLQDVIGIGYGLGRFPNAAEQTNYFANHGINLTTNSFWFNQVGQRVELFNEEDATQIGNHFMYKLTDTLALGDALSKLDPTLDFERLNKILEAGSNKTEASLEGILDGLRKTLVGTPITDTPIGDSSDSAQSRLDYHKSLTDLFPRDEQGNPTGIFATLQGKVKIESVPANGLSGRDDFGAFLSLAYLSPIALQTTDADAIAALKKSQGTLASRWEEDQALNAIDRAAGDANFSDAYLTDRAAMLSWIIKRNTEDSDKTTIPNINEQYFRDFASNTIIRTGSEFWPAGDLEKRRFLFGGSDADTLLGGSKKDRLYGGDDNDIINGQDDNDYLEGNAGNDQLIGGSGKDELLGGTGDDTLTGGVDNDTLKGGAGDDTYIFNDGDGTDTIIDSDGQGEIVWGGTLLTVGKKVADNIWQSADGQFTYALMTGATAQAAELVIKHLGPNGKYTDDELHIQHFKTGQLGLDITVGKQADPTPQGGTYTAVLSDTDSDTVRGFKYFYADQFTAYLRQRTDAGATATDIRSISYLGQGSDKNDVLSAQGTVSTAAGQYNFDGTARIDGRGGDDTVVGGNGDDTLSGGTGSDTVYGGEGNDVIDGGDGNDYLQSGKGRDVVDGGADDDVIDAAWNQHFNSGNNYLFHYAPSAALANPQAILAKEGFDQMAVPDADGNIVQTYSDTVAGQDGLVFDKDGHLDYVYTLFGAEASTTYNDHGSTHIFTLTPAEHSPMLHGRSAKEFEFISETIEVGDRDSIGHRQVVQTALGVAGTVTDDVYGTSDFVYKESLLIADTESKILSGGDGNDKIFSADGNDLITGDAGDDIILGNGGDDTISGGDGSDQIAGGTGNDDIEGNNDRDWLWGEEGNDVLDGGAGNDLLAGQTGDDSLYGGDGWDILFGDDSEDATALGLPGDAGGQDYLDGGAGSDRMSGGGNADELFGGDGDDFLVGDGDAIAAANQGDDYLDGEAGDDVLRGNGGNDTLFGGIGNDNLFGDAGNDYLDGGDGDDYLDGGHGNDTLIGGAGTNTLVGGDGDDTLSGSHGKSTLLGGAGNDTYLLNEGDSPTTMVNGNLIVSNSIVDTEGHNKITFGAGITEDSLQVKYASGRYYIQYSGTDAIAIGNALSGTISSVQFADGHQADFGQIVSQHSYLSVVGSIQDGTLNGGSESDYLHAMGRAVVNGGRGNDFLFGQNGNNTYFYNRGDGQDAIDEARLYGGTHSKIIFGEGISASDIQVKFDDRDTLITFKNSPTDAIRLISSSVTDWSGDELPAIDRFCFADGSDFTFAQLTSTTVNVIGTNGDDVLEGRDHIYSHLSGGNGNDSLKGGSGDDVLAGDAGNDKLFGLSGNDALVGGTGNDYFDGGYGDDRYIFDIGDGQDVIYQEPTTYRPTEIDEIRFGVGITPGSILTNITSGDQGYSMDVQYGPNRDSVQILNAFEIQKVSGEPKLVPGLTKRAVFVDGTVLSIEDLLQHRPSLSLTGTDANDVLIGGGEVDQVSGGDGVDTLFGLAGDDVLAGGAGDDVLIGGDGNDTYVMALHGGVDKIFDSADGTELIQFSDAVKINDLHSVRFGSDLYILNNASDMGAQIAGYFDNQNANKNWMIKTGDGVRSLDQWQGNYSVEDEVIKLKQQFEAKLHDAFQTYDYETSHGYDFSGRELPNESYTFDGIQVANLNAIGAMTQLQDSERDGFIGTKTVTVHTSYWEPQYVTVTTGGGLIDFPSIPGVTGAAIPPGYSVVYIPVTGGTPTGAPGTSADSSPNYIVKLRQPTVYTSRYIGSKLIGKDSTYTVDQYSQSLTLQRIVGDDENNTITAVQRDESNDVIGGVEFRGSISAGGGDDYVDLWGGEADWWHVAKRPNGEKPYYRDPLTGNIEVGMGAFVDGGTGEDTIFGSSGEDTIVGGDGNDIMDGTTGDDTYFIAATDTGVDTISDSGYISPWCASEDADDPYGGILPQDVLLFGDGISVESLGYRIVDDERFSGKEILELEVNKNEKVRIVYDDIASSAPGQTGIEKFRFSDDVELTTAQLLQFITKLPDHLTSSVSIILPSTADSVTLTGTDDLAATGNAIDNLLQGNSGANILDGAGGADEMRGAGGDDTYIVDNLGDVVIESANEGIDAVESNVTYALAANVESLTLTGEDAINGNGNELDNILVGNSAANFLDGGIGGDKLIGGAGDDTYVFNLGDGKDQIDNSAADYATTTDTIEFGAGISSNGGVVMEHVGDDLLIKVSDTDSITVKDYFAAGDLQKIDQIKFSDNTLWNQAAIESRVTLSQTGTVYAHTLTGTSANDLIRGLDGNDMIQGLAGDDSLFGGDGDDLLDGGAGVDQMNGGAGNDTYIVDNASDEVVENSNEGTADLIQSNIILELGANVENLELTGSGSINGFGNSLDNVITGNDANNSLAGFAGADTLIGGAGDDVLDGGADGDIQIGGTGNDFYFVDNIDDVIIENENEGCDGLSASISTVLAANIEMLFLSEAGAIDGGGNALDNYLSGNSSANKLTGGAGDDDLLGNAGDDVLDGGVGNDQLIGGVGQDTYLFSSGFGRDTIFDSSSTPAETDIIRLNGIAAADVTVQRDPSGLLLNINNTTDQIVLAQWFDGVQYKNKKVQFDDGTIWDNAALEGRITAAPGTAADDALYGSDANENLNGLDGNDQLYGFGGNDTLQGGTGTDWLEGGAGNDTLIGGDGDDSYQFNLGDGHDTVIELAGAGSGSDFLYLGAGIDAATTQVSQDGMDLILDLNLADQVKIVGYFGTDTVETISFDGDGAEWNLAEVRRRRLALNTPAGNPGVASLAGGVENNPAAQFKEAMTISPSFSEWALSSSTLDFYLTSSDALGLNGDMAYQNDSGGDISTMAASSGLLASPLFGTAIGNLRTNNSLQNTSLLTV